MCNVSQDTIPATSPTRKSEVEVSFLSPIPLFMVFTASISVLQIFPFTPSWLASQSPDLAEVKRLVVWLFGAATIELS